MDVRFSTVVNTRKSAYGVLKIKNKTTAISILLNSVSYNNTEYNSIYHLDWIWKILCSYSNVIIHTIHVLYSCISKQISFQQFWVWDCERLFLYNLQIIKVIFIMFVFQTCFYLDKLTIPCFILLLLVIRKSMSGCLFLPSA